MRPIISKTLSGVAFLTICAALTAHSASPAADSLLTTLPGARTAAEREQIYIQLADLHADSVMLAAGYWEKALAEADKAGDAVRFDHVSLTYAGAGAPSLSDISFTAKRGQTIGVIGGTGSGKSSLVNLIPRFYDATEGTVEILGRPAADYPREALRGKVNVVMQKAQLFGGTIRSNLLWGNKNATDAELWAALETAQAAEFVQAKPLGLDEPVEQGGRNLSGGQKQRLTIARALVGKPDILILDDSASALDYATDAALRKALAALPGSLTVFIVSQRAASLQHADQILVLDDGRLVGLGTHDQLRQSCPVYEEIYESQFKKGDVQK